MWTKISGSRYIGLAAAVATSVLVYNRWFFSNRIFGWGDWGFLFSETVREWLALPSAWIGVGLGHVDIGLSMYLPVRIFYGILARFMDFNYFDKIVFLFPSVIVPCVGAFYLVKKVTRSAVAAIVGSFVYLFNTYVLMLNTGHFTLSVAFGIGVFVFLLYQKTLETQKYFWAVMTGLVAFLEFSYEARAFYLTVWILILYFIYSLCCRPKFQVKELIRSICLSAVPAVATILLSSFWWTSLFINSSSFAGIVAGRQLYGEGHFQIQRALTAFHPFWTGGHRLVWGAPQQISWWFWLIPPVAFTGYWLNRKNKQIVFWMIMSLLGIFLTKFTSLPFTGVYLWLYQHLPGFSAFRESSKFNYFIDLGYAVLIGSFVASVLRSNLNRWFKSLLIIGVSGLFLINTRPVFMGQLGRLLTPRHIPQDYQVLKNFIQKQPEFFRVLYFPRYSRWGYWDTLHPSLGVAELVGTEWKSLNDYNKTGLEYSAFEELTAIFKKDFSADLLDGASVKYVVVPAMDLENEEMFIFYSEPRQRLVDFLDKLPYLKKIDIGASELVIYENYQNKPHLYLANGAPVNAVRISPSQYELTFVGTNLDNEILFSENFHSGWKARVGNFSWWKTLFEKNYFVPDENHSKTNAGLNMFVIPKLDSGAKVTLYFAPQAWINLGSIISLLTLASSSVFLIVSWKNTHDQKQ